MPEILRISHDCASRCCVDVNDILVSEDSRVKVNTHTRKNESKTRASVATIVMFVIQLKNGFTMHWSIKVMDQPCHVNRFLLYRHSSLCNPISMKICRITVYYVPRRIIRVIMHCRSSRNYPNCVHWHIFYFMWLQCVYEFLCVHSNLI